MIDKTIEKFWKIACQHYPQIAKYPPPRWKFAKLGKTAARAYDSHRIEINEILFNENKEDFFAVTIPHEVAHCVVFRAYSERKPPHGVEWKRVMREFGLKPEIYHSYSIKSTSRLRIFEYVCECKTWELTSIRHNRILKGQEYFCPHCKAVLEHVED
jgi:SprT protein